MYKTSTLIKTKISELRKLRNDLYTGDISTREYQDKEKEVKDEVKEKEGIAGVLALNKELRKLEMEDYELRY